MFNSMLTALRRGPVLYPFLFAVYPILFVWSNNIEELSVFSSTTDLLLPIAIVEIIAAFLLGLFWFFFRDWRGAGVFVVFVFLIFFSYGHALEAIAELGHPEYASNIYLGIAWLLIFTVGTLLLFLFRKKLWNLANPLNVATLTLIVFTLPNTFAYEQPPSNLPAGQEVGTVPASDSIQVEPGTLPDIYYITTEGYTGSKGLSDVLDFDNSSFTGYLKQKGFYVTPEGNSNYPSTDLSLASSLNMESVQSIYGSDEPALATALYARIRDNKAMRFARSHGYQVVYLSDQKPAGSEELGDLYYGCGARRLGIHREGFVDALLRSTALNPVLTHFNVLESSLNDLRVCDFYQLAKTQEITGPKVVIVHLRVPGYPFVIGADGEVIALTPEYVRTQGYIDAYLNQMTWTNGMLVWLFETLLSDQDNQPVIVLQGDHGEGAGTWDLAPDDLIRAKFSILNAYFFPGGSDGFLYPEITPVNSFRTIFNRYLGANYDLQDDRSYTAFGLNDKFRDVTDIVNQSQGN